jgi:hypothetical protein
LQPDLNIRRTLASLCSKDISCIEELPAMVRTLQNQATI